jgi:hypothetical protein
VLPDGVHTIQVVAIDEVGQETGSQTGEVRVDRRRPRARLRLRGRKLTVSLSDGRQPRGSGLRRGSLRILFGDGAKRARRRQATHTYPSSGSYRVRVRARDRAGNVLVLNRRMRIR